MSRFLNFKYRKNSFLISCFISVWIIVFEEDFLLWLTFPLILKELKVLLRHMRFFPLWPSQCFLFLFMNLHSFEIRFQNSSYDHWKQKESDHWSWKIWINHNTNACSKDNWSQQYHCSSVIDFYCIGLVWVSISESHHKSAKATHNNADLIDWFCVCVSKSKEHFDQWNGNLTSSNTTCTWHCLKYPKENSSNNFWETKSGEDFLVETHRVLMIWKTHTFIFALICAVKRGYLVSTI